MKTIISLLAIATFVSCSTNQKLNDEQLNLSFSVNGNAEAMPSFQKALRLLHNFEYEDAADAFIEAQKIDPDFAMAYWGEAMTHNHSVWADLDIDKAREAFTKLGNTKEERISKTQSELEKDFILSLEILYGEGTKKVREREYANYLAGMYERYPDETEVAAFYALALLGTKSDWSNMEDANFKAAKISQDILNKNPMHPGALHYLVHANDHPEYATLSLDAARNYAKFASYAGHALHMPSHIYLALGMWPDVVRSNEVSYQASVDRKTNRDLPNDELDYHSHLWLLYGYLQQGRYADAARVLKEQIRLTDELPSPRARFHLLMMKGHYLAETKDGQDELSSIEVSTDDLMLAVRSIDKFIEGLHAFYKKDTQGLSNLIVELEKDLKVSHQRMLESEDASICGVTAYVDKAPSRFELENGEMLLLELKGMKAWLENNPEAAEIFLKGAIEKSKGYLIGPPKVVKPVQELYGEFLLENNRPQEALKQFEDTEKASPNRLLTMKGRLAAAKQLGDEEKIKEVEKKLNELLLSKASS